MDRFVVNFENDVVVDLGENDKGIKRLKNEACENNFFYENGLAFNVTSSLSLVKILHSIGSYGRGLKPPTLHELSISLLIKLEGNTIAIVAEMLHKKAGEKMLLDLVVEEVEEDFVVQVVTYNASNYKKAGGMLMQKRKQLWWTPYDAHCIDLMLEKIEYLPQHQNALKKAKNPIGGVPMETRLRNLEIHTKKRNRLGTKKLNSLVYIMYNKRLQYKFLKKKTLKDNDDPLVSEDLSSDDDPLVEEDVVEGTSTDVDISQPSGSQQVDEECGYEDISNQYESPGTSNDDDDEDCAFDPRFKPLDIDDSL
ncbi:hypothetical protein Dsin_016010 [Dipteronia sinensis]|uniref:DUF659 domain-containing protein n=1 Tax=Dipteronia sinensis TaxID=43782 RepID=A0AAE0ACL6_9ROSI|nr:hypothetical protein Dsin_016010 [Dipteronia sinensis]